MPLPDFQSFMLPVLRHAASQPSRSVPKSELQDVVTKALNISDTERQEMLPSGTMTTVASRTGWACTYMKKAGLLESPQRAHIRITKRGIDFLATNPSGIRVSMLKQFPEFKAFHESGRKDREDASPATEAITERPPIESVELGYQALREELAADIQEKIGACSPAFFERLVVELLVKMGYGGSLRDAAQVVGKSGDGGIDGIIKEDKLGLDAIYIQAKRWNEKTVGRPDVQQFAGALAGNKASKGIYITTSSFTKEAFEFVKSVGTKIVLVDGTQLAELMIDHNVGVSIAQSYEVKRIDSDYFAEGE